MSVSGIDKLRKEKNIPMSHCNTIRAWKDEQYRLSLSEAERAQMPAHPAGIIELRDPELGVVKRRHIHLGLYLGSGVLHVPLRHTFLPHTKLSAVTATGENRGW